MRKDPSLRRELATNVVWSATAHLLSRGSLVLSSIVLARTLDTQAFAAYSYFQLTVSMLAAYASMGLGITASKFFAQWTNANQSGPPPPLGALYILALFAGVAFGILTWIAPSSWIQGENLNIPSYLMGVGVFLVTLSIIPNSAIIGLELYAASTGVAIFSAVVLLIGTSLAASLQSAPIAMITFLVGSLIQAGGNAWLTIRKIGLDSFTKTCSLRSEVVLHIFSLAGPMLIVGLLAASGSWLVGRIILADPDGVHGFALYAIGLQWYALALFLPGVISRVLLPHLIKAKKGHDNSPVLLKNGVLVTLSAASTVAFIGGILTFWILPFYGPVYSDQQWLLIAFLFAAIPHAPATTLSNALVAATAQWTWLAMMIAWFAVLILLAVSTKSLGPWSGALSLGLASAALTGISYFYAKRRSLL